MASQSADPPAPQTEVVKTSTTNNKARIGTYTDQSLTKRNSVEVAAPSDLPAPKSTSGSQGDIREVYANDKQSEIQNTEAASANVNVDPPPHAPNKWTMQTRSGRRYARDMYANGGISGYLNNNG